MAKQIAFIVTDSGIITAVANGKSYPIPPDHRYYKELKEAVIKDDVATLERLAHLSQAVATFAQGQVTVRDGVVFYGAEPLRNALTDRILRLMNEGFPFGPFVKFLENLMLNPSKRSVDQLYNFLEHQGLPITEDGCFLAYKRVQDDWSDFHSGKLFYKIGSVVELPRNQVDDDPDSACSTGLHAGALSYVSGFNSGGHLIIVKIHPRDCVSVPKDANCTKLRTCRLEVVGEYTGELHQPLYTSTGAPSTPSTVNNSEDDDEYEDDEYEDEYDDDNDDDEEEDFDDEEEDFDDEDDDDDGDEPDSPPATTQEVPVVPTPVPGQPVVVPPPTVVVPETPVATAPVVPQEPVPTEVPAEPKAEGGLFRRLWNS